MYDSASRRELRMPGVAIVDMNSLVLGGGPPRENPFLSTRRHSFRAFCIDLVASQIEIDSFFDSTFSLLLISQEYAFA